MNATRSAVLDALMAATAEAPLERRLLVVPRLQVGRELLRSLTLAGVDWIGWDVVTPSRLAGELVAGTLAAEGLAVADAYEEAALLDTAIDAALAGASGSLAALSDAPGLRRAIATSVHALRQAGVDAALLDRVPLRDEDKRAQVARIVSLYEASLERARRVDSAQVLLRAARGIAECTLRVSARVWLLPGLERRGAAGALLDALLRSGARTLTADPVIGLTYPAGLLSAPESSAVSRLSLLHAPSHTAECDDSAVRISLFRAASVSAELREVLRRVRAMGLAWDEVEIIATDAAEYGVALEVLTQQLDVPVTFAMGLPAARTRPGRAALQFLRWLERGMPAELLRRLLEGGELDAGEMSGAVLARRVRSLRIGAGRDRYDDVIARRLAELEVAPGDDVAAVERERAELHALRDVVTELTAALPRGNDCSAADVANALLALVARLRVQSAVDAGVRARLAEVLARIRASAVQRTSRATAVAAVAAHVERLMTSGTQASWSSAGGALHFSDLRTGGWTGRRATFIVGLDAGRFPGPGGADALLVDDDRARLNERLGARALASATERVAERRHALAALLARLRGDVIVSWPVWQPLEGRALTPAAEVLQVHRLASGAVTADYDALSAAAGPVASAVPSADAALLDGDDVWLDALAVDGTLRRGLKEVCIAFPDLGRGVFAWRDRTLPRTEPGPLHGAIAPRPALDPRVNPDLVMSATSLQALGTCPHRYLLRHVLRVRPADVPDPGDGWLTPLQRGRLLHGVYERSLRELRSRQIDTRDAAWDATVLRVLDEALAEMRTLVPPPGEGVFAAEAAALRADANGFAAMVREDGGDWIELEFRFGGGPLPPLTLELGEGDRIGVEGVIDRIDRLEDGRLVVIDYKTGSRARFEAGTGVWDGSRRLQHALYTMVAEQVADADVARAEYVFPGRRNQNFRAAFEREKLAEGGERIRRLLDFVANGWFVPTAAAEDCGTCEYAAVCRARLRPWGKVDSPMAEFMAQAIGPAADAMRGIRR